MCAWKYRIWKSIASAYINLLFVHTLICNNEYILKSYIIFTLNIIFSLPEYNFSSKIQTNQHLPVWFRVCSDFLSYCGNKSNTKDVAPTIQFHFSWVQSSLVSTKSKFVDFARKQTGSKYNIKKNYLSPALGGERSEWKNGQPKLRCQITVLKRQVMSPMWQIYWAGLSPPPPVSPQNVNPHFQNSEKHNLRHHSKEDRRSYKDVVRKHAVMNHSSETFRHLNSVFLTHMDTLAYRPQCNGGSGHALIPVQQKSTGQLKPLIDILPIFIPTLTKNLVLDTTILSGSTPHPHTCQTINIFFPWMGPMC